MADEKVNMGPEENKPPETQSPPGQGDLPPLEENNAPAVSGEDKAAPDHVEPDPPSADKHTQQTVLPGMGEDTPAPSGKVINLSDIQAADKGGKEASTTAPEKKAPEADQPKKRRGRPPKEQAAVSAGKKEKAAEPRTGRPSKVDKAAREEAPPAVRDKVVCTPSSRQRNNLQFTPRISACIPHGTDTGLYAASRRSWTSMGVRTPRPRWRRRKL